MSYMDLVVGIVAGLVTVAAVFGLMAWLVGRQSLERRGVLRFDTPTARSALRRCNPARDVHYFGGRQVCECGEVTYPLQPIAKRGGYQPTALGPPPTEPPPKPEAA